MMEKMKIGVTGRVTMRVVMRGVKTDREAVMRE